MMNSSASEQRSVIKTDLSTSILTAVKCLLEIGAGLAILFYIVGLLLGLIEIATFGVVVGVACAVSSLCVGTVQKIVTDPPTG